MIKNKVLVLFDFDGTITKKDSFWDFIFFSHSALQLIYKTILALPIFVCYKFKILDADIAKQKIFSTFFKGWKEEVIILKGEAYCASRINKIIRKDALIALKNHQQHNDTICIVTASSSFWIKPWTDLNNYEIISTNYEIKNGIVTGEYRSKNCKGVEKVNRINAIYQLDYYDEIVCYGDTKDDLPMLEIGSKKFYKYFNG